jgi:hypothetical protein
MKCENKRINNWCNNKDVKVVQRKSKSVGTNSTNEFNGETLLMCRECRKANNGGFKIVS